MNQEPPYRPFPDELRALLRHRPHAEQVHLERTWDMLEVARPQLSINEQRKAQLRTALQEATRPGLRLLPRYITTYSFPRIAVAATILLLIGAALVFRFSPISITVPAGSTSIVELPDGSSVELNSGSTLTYDHNFGSTNRTLKLNGEAFFMVKKASYPFSVQTFNAVVSVLGTQFNVRARSDDVTPSTSVFVATGVVRFSTQNNQQAFVQLSEGLFSEILGQSPTPTLPDTLAHMQGLAWRNGGFAFQNRPLGIVFDEIARRFDLTIVASDDLRSRPFAFWKQNASAAEAVLDDLTRASGLRYRPVAGGYEIFQ